MTRKFQLLLKSVSTTTAAKGLTTPTGAVLMLKKEA